MRTTWATDSILASADMVTLVNSCDTTSQLRLAEGEAGEAVYVRSAAVLGDGGSGTWRWAASSGIADNFALHIQPLSISGAARWERDTGTGPFDFAWWAPDTTGTVASDAVFQAADIAAKAAGRTLAIRGGAIRLSQSYVMTSRLSIDGTATIKPDAGVTITLSQTPEVAHAQHMFDISAGGVVNIARPTLPVIPNWWGAKGTAIVATIAVAIAASSNALIADAAEWTAADIGKIIIVPGAGAPSTVVGGVFTPGAYNGELHSTITAVSSDGRTATLADQAQQTVSDGATTKIIYGYDDAPAIKATLSSSVSGLAIRVHCLAGNYLQSGGTTIYNGGISVRGLGLVRHIAINAANPSTYDLWHFTSGDIDVRDMKFEATEYTQFNDVPGVSSLLRVLSSDGGGTVVNNVRVSGCEFHGGYSGLFTGAVNRCWIESNYTYKTYYNGIDIAFAPAYLYVLNNLCRYSGTNEGIKAGWFAQAPQIAQNIFITGNTVEYCGLLNPAGQQEAIDFFSGPVKFLRVCGNIMRNCGGNGGLEIKFGSLAGLSPNAEMYCAFDDNTIETSAGVRAIGIHWPGAPAAPAADVLRYISVSRNKAYFTGALPLSSLISAFAISAGTDIEFADNEAYGYYSGVTFSPGVGWDSTVRRIRCARFKARSVRYGIYIKGGILENLDIVDPDIRASQHGILIGSSSGMAGIPISGMASNGWPGAIRAQTSAAHGLKSNQWAYVTGALGETDANGYFQVQAPDTNHFDEVGTTYGGLYTSGGTVVFGYSMSINMSVRGGKIVSTNPATTTISTITAIGASPNNAGLLQVTTAAAHTQPLDALLTLSAINDGGSIGSARVSNSGADYTSIPVISAASGAGAAFSCTMCAVNVTIVNPGTGGTDGSTVIRGTTGSGEVCQVSVTIKGGIIVSIDQIIQPGLYTVLPANLAAEPFTVSGLTGALLAMSIGVSKVTASGGINYTNGDDLIFTGGSPSTPAAGTIVSASSNANWAIIPTGTNTFDLQGSTAAGYIYTSGGTAKAATSNGMQIRSAHNIRIQDSYIESLHQAISVVSAAAPAPPTDIGTIDNVSIVVRQVGSPGITIGDGAWTISARATLSSTSPGYTVTGTGSVTAAHIRRGQLSATPQGAYAGAVGDYFDNGAPSVGAALSWVCTAAGTYVTTAWGAATQIGSAAGRSITVSSGPVALSSSDSYVGVTNTGSAGITLTLPAGPQAGQTVTIKDESGTATTYALTIAPAAGNIDGAASIVINVAYGWATLRYSGTQWSQTA